MTLEPFKIVGQLIACEKDANDDVVGERVVADMVLYAPQFGELEARVRAAWPEIEAAARASAAQPSGRPPTGEA
jgi:hypothetical protein